MAATKEKLPKFLTMRGFREHIIDWSDDKIRRLIESGELPAKQEPSGRYVFETAVVLEWFKRRTVVKTA